MVTSRPLAEHWTPPEAAVVDVVELVLVVVVVGVGIVVPATLLLVVEVDEVLVVLELDPAGAEELVDEEEDVVVVDEPITVEDVLVVDAPINVEDVVVVPDPSVLAVHVTPVTLLKPPSEASMTM